MDLYRLNYWPLYWNLLINSYGMNGHLCGHERMNILSSVNASTDLSVISA